ncbi:MAG: hypothetical protein ACM3ZQ_02630 [Bacillota bacterium]
MKRSLPIAISFVAGLIYVISVFFASPTFNSIKDQADKWYQISTAFAVLLGIINLTLVHGRSVSQKRTNWQYSIIILAAMYGVMLLGLSETSTGKNYMWVFNNTMVPLGATMYAMLAFYISSAAYRVFKVRSVEAGLLMISAVIIMMGNVPAGEMIWKGFPVVGKWLMQVPNTAGMRGITIGATLGASATALRILLGIERGHLSGGE